MIARLGLAAPLVALALAACAGSSLDVPPCATPVPLALSDGAGWGLQTREYIAHVEAGAVQLQVLSEDFTDRWPTRELRNDTRFRSDFAAYASAAQCSAEALRDLARPDWAALGADAETIAQMDAFDEVRARLMREYEEVTQLGIKAVGTRNKSDFRRWERREREVAQDLADTFGSP